MTLKELLESLPEKDRKLLQYAFENGLAQSVRVKDSNLYVGVNIQYPNSSYEVSEEIGIWSRGNLK